MNPIECCRRAVEDARALIATVRAEELTASTPCTDWDARQLIAHMVGVCHAFTAVLRGGTMDATVAKGGATFDGDDPIAAYEWAADEVMREWESPGALEKTLQMPFGPTPAAMGIRVFTADQLIHAWDLATAIGRPHRIDEGLAAQTLELMQGLLRPEMRGPGRGFGEAHPCPEDASVQDRLLAFSGRATVAT